MIKIFRRIRQRLIDEGNLKRYSIYAFGEILLVMIGILLALQVNNWNQNRLLKDELNDSFKNLLLDIEEDQLGFKILDSVLIERLEAAETIQKMFFDNNQLSDIDKIRNLVRLGNRNLRYNSGTYDALLNTGLLYKIKNKDLQTQIKEYYETLEEWVKVFEEMGNSSRFVRDQEILIPFRFILEASDNIYVPNTKSLIWMNDLEHPVFQAVQTYLAFYIRQHNGHNGKLELVQRISAKNDSLNQKLSYNLGFSNGSKK